MNIYARIGFYFTSEENEETKSLFLISDFENRSNGSNGLLSKLNRQDKLFNSITYLNIIVNVKK